MKLFSTSCDTQFLGWDAPLLPRAVAWLQSRFAKDESFDLSGLLCVLPAAGSAKRFDQLLRATATRLDLSYRPPPIITVGQLAERLYRPGLPVALELEQTLAWARSLRSKHADELAPLLPTIPPAEPIGPWLELAGTLRRLHEELSSSQLTFGEVVEVAETESEQRRWKQLAELFSSYQSELAEAELADPYTARREAVHQDRCSCDRTIVLIGTSDLSDALIAMLRSLDSELISLVAAPANAMSRFDEFGCVDTDGWMNHHLPIKDRHLLGAGDVADQATAVAEVLAEYSDRYSAGEVTLGVTDESQVGPLEFELRGCDVITHRHLGWTLKETAVGRLLDLTAVYLQRGTWQSLAALVRHADVHRQVTRHFEASNPSEAEKADDAATGPDPSCWMTQLDRLMAEHYPVRVADRLPRMPREAYPLAAAVGQWVERWLSVFSSPDQSIAAWSKVVGQWLGELYEQPTVDRPTESISPDDSPTIPVAGTSPDADQPVATRTQASLAAAARLLDRFSDLNRRLDLNVSGQSAIEMLAGRLADVRIFDPPDPQSVPVRGWLDLSLDDSPALVVMGLNHPFVPGAVTSDPFLPGALRTRLRMADNDRRFTRDLYAMHLMMTSRRDTRFVVGRTAADQSPTPPSRLLAAAPSEDAARRIRTLLGGRRESVVVRHRWDIGDNESRLPIPKLPLDDDAKSIEVMSVTAFRDYLMCPYRFYLRHVLKLKPLDDSSGELAANQFGDLVHGALERFGESEDCGESSRSKIESLLIGHLHDYAADHYGDSVSSAVTLQIAQAERRLRAVASHQAQRVADGWEIYASEASVGERQGACIEIDGKRMGLRGRFDRIDHHRDTGRWAILDYKTHGHKPEKKHLRKTREGVEWIDLQLPLYRLMVPYLGIDADPVDVQLGYFNVSEKEEETGIHIANFSEALLQQAEQLIHKCILGIWAGDFEPTHDRVPFDDYGVILQAGVTSGMLDQTDVSIESGADA